MASQRTKDTVQIITIVAALAALAWILKLI